MDRVSRRLTPSMVVALLALFFAFGGGAYAASHYLITSTKQVSPKVLKSLRGRAGPAGPIGPQGATGPPGKDGANGTNAATHIVTRFTDTAITAGNDIYGTANCNAGETITGGGFGITGAAFNTSNVIRSGLTYSDTDGATPGGSWIAGVHSTNTGTLRVWAICASP
jgi:hypothetical protein